MINESGGKEFRERQEAALAFGEIVAQLESPEPEVRLSGEELFLNMLAIHGVNGFAEWARDGLEPIPELYVPADESEVRDYLSWVRTMPPLKLTDVGSVDQKWVADTRLTPQMYVDEIRAILEFADVQFNELSVLTFPEVRQRMREVELEGFKKFIILQTLNMHGIAFRIDNEDAKAWQRLKEVVEDLSGDMFKDYSEYLRKKHGKDISERVPLRDVVTTMDETRQAVKRMIALARGNLATGEWEKQRMYETLPERVRKLLESYFAEHDELDESELRDSEVPDINE